jgi:hypothetical protein
MRKGDKLLCLKNINNLFDQPLFIKGEIYEVLYVDNEGISIEVCLNHILYANEYNTFKLEWVNKNFKKH